MSAPPQEPLQLPAPGDKEEISQLQAGGPAVKLEDLGPMVVNSDGTLSRISNWSSLSELERERTLRVLAARNKIRLAAEEEKLKASGSAS
ncbi:hypothetical protein FB45DRAFT_930816 [Roridomyces roridus]|uniref:Uncharacterized protein n=1 Tax=Roridomyces roridus TaxID=1738132 RepID=A0AAD7BFJ6_9AGAR|nr:hypothetical protein FB45DRAFT_930816 [Roridomyces roridus]